MIRVAALTSYATSDLRSKIRAAAAAGIRCLDLYCFFPADWAVLCGRGRPARSASGGMAGFDAALAAERVAAWCREPGAADLDICGIATFEPDISSVYEANRVEAVARLGAYLEFLAALRRGGFSCRTFELVAGHTIVREPDGSSCQARRLDERLRRTGSGRRPGRPGLDPPVYMRSVDPEDVQRALLRSLADLKRRADRLDWGSAGPPWLAFELEPSISRLVHDERTLARFVGACLRASPYGPVGLNLDIGHMNIVRIRPEAFFAAWAGHVVHAHISDNFFSHFADLPVLAAHSDPEFFRPWLRGLVALGRRPGTVFQGVVSVEMEAWGDVGQVAESVRTTEGWLRELEQAPAAPGG